MKPILSGQIHEEQIFNLLKTINFEKEHKLDCISYDIIVNQIIDYMNKNFEKLQATVTEFVSGKELLKLDRRKCAKYTFDSYDIECKIKEIITIFEFINNENKNIEQIIVEPSHFDILYYGKDDEFKFHRDKINSDSPGRDYQYYTLLIGLIDTKEGGETLIVNPETKKIQKYSQSASQNGYIMFPSTEKHAGNKIIDGSKLCFKFDAWIKFKTHKINIDTKSISKEIISLNTLLFNIQQIMPDIYNLILEKNRIMMSKILPFRTEVNSEIENAVIYFKDLMTEIEYVLESQEEYIAVQNKISKSRSRLFTKAAYKRIDFQYLYDDDDDYISDYEDDNYCNGYEY